MYQSSITTVAIIICVRKELKAHIKYVAYPLIMAKDSSLEKKAPPGRTVTVSLPANPK